MGNLSRRSFLKGAGLATGAAIIGASPIAASAASEEAPELVANPSALPKEPLVAYVRDADKGEVSVLLGKDEVTYRDPALTKRLLKAARRRKHGAGEVA
jgi:TAT (twin-arginine translocation) pathway-exported protein